MVVYNIVKYFSSFESLAKRYNGPKNIGQLCSIVSVFEGKAKKVHVYFISKWTICKYDVVEETTLKAYEQVPEAYREKFRSQKQKWSNQTYVEFAREKMNKFDRWLHSMDLEEDFTKMRELVLVEKFKECVPSEVRTYLSDRGVVKWD